MVLTVVSIRSIVYALALLFFATISKRLLKFISTKRRQGAYPPGPSPKWLVGNLHNFPTVNVPQEYAAWSKKYNSSIVHVSSFGIHLIIVNKRADIEELFERRAATYSDRPEIPVVSLLGWESWLFGFFPYGDFWRLHRKICKQNFGQVAVKQYYPIYTRKARELLQGFLQTPEKFEHHCKMYSLSIPLMAMYGYEPASIDDPVIVAAAEATALGAALLLPGASLVNVLPILRHVPIWFPGASTRKVAAEARKMNDKSHRIPVENFKKKMANGTAEPSLISAFFEKKNTVGASEEEERATTNVAHTVCNGASDTTMSSTVTFVYLMAVNPDVQSKAQEEIDRVVGADRLPDFSDRQSLPYVEAIYREVMRWKPPLPLAAPHRVIEDDYYKGHFIPKGSLVISNLWGMSHDEDVYPDPLAFKPERFLDDDGNLTSDDADVAFGFGRRACAGKYFGSSAMWLFMVSILSSFNISKARDEHGKEIPIEEEYYDFGMVSHKKEFRCSIVPQSTAARELVQTSFKLDAKT